jgi:DNA-binding transcriptional ArsR family regulator
MRPTSTFESITAALLSPTRRAMLAWTEGQWLTVTELAEKVGIAVSTCSYHAGVLHRSGLLVMERSGRQVHVTAKYGAHEFIIQRRAAKYPVPVLLADDEPAAAAAGPHPGEAVLHDGNGRSDADPLGAGS